MKKVRQRQLRTSQMKRIYKTENKNIQDIYGRNIRAKSSLSKSINQNPDIKQKVQINKTIDKTYFLQKPQLKKQFYNLKISNVVKKFPNIKTQPQKKTSYNNLIDRQYQQQQQKYMHNSLKQLINKLPKQQWQRNKQNLKQHVQQLKIRNFFFKKLEDIVILSFLKICKTKFFAPKQYIYKQSEQVKSFYIILYGRIVLLDKKLKFKTILQPGQTFSEQILFRDSEKLKSVVRLSSKAFPHLEDAKALDDCCVLEIYLDQYLKMASNLKKCGFKQEYLVVENLISRNFNNKNSIRNQFI